VELVEQNTILKLEKQTPKAKRTPPQLSLRLPRVAEAMDVSLRTVQRLVADGHIRSFKLNRARLCRLKDLEEFLAQRSA
jgi:excisionase family DNA binding protein